MTFYRLENNLHKEKKKFLIMWWLEKQLRNINRETL
jgi:hypothetical protein